MAEVTDDQLLCQARRGDGGAVDLLVRRHAKLVYGMALRQTRDQTLAADIAQAVFIVFIRRLGSIRSARVLPNWFMQTTRYAVLDARRRERRREHHERQAARPEKAMNTTNESDETAMLDHAIARLRKGDRQVIIMRFLQGSDIPSIAMTLHISEAAARKRVARALERLKQMFDGKQPVMSVDAMLATAAAVTIPPTVLEACAAIAATGVASTATAAAVAQGVLKNLAMQKLALAGVVMLAIIGVAGAVGAATLLDKPRPRSLAVAPAPAAAPDKAALLAALSRTYTLAPDQLIRVIRPPFPQERMAWVDAEFPEARGAANVRSMGFRLGAQGLQWRYMSYADESLAQFLETALQVPWYRVEGLERLDFAPVHGDIVFRDAMPIEQKMDTLAALITEVSGKATTVSSATRRRLCIVLTAPTRPATRNVRRLRTAVLSQEPLDDAALQQAINRTVHPDGWTQRYSFRAAARLMGAPFFHGEREAADISGDTYLIAADAHLDPADPQHAAKLTRVLENLQKQVGGQWNLEERELGVFTLEQAPG